MVVLMFPCLHLLRGVLLSEQLDLMVTNIFPRFHIESKIFVNIDVLLGIKRISTLKKKIIERKDSVEIGAAITFSEIIESEIIKKYFPLLVKTASQIGSVQIRNRATIVGNFVNNTPCADSAPPLLVYDAKIEIQSLTRKKIIPLQKFLIKPYHTQPKKRNYYKNYSSQTRCKFSGRIQQTWKATSHVD